MITRPGVVCGDEVYSSFEELGNAILASLPNRRQPVKWWKCWGITVWHYEDCAAKTPWQRIKVFLPHFSTHRSWVGYFWLDVYVFNKWDIMFTCGYYRNQGGE